VNAHTVGRKYDSNRSTNEIATAIRQDIKAAQARPAGDPWGLPRSLKVSVRTRKYAGGCSIDVRVTRFVGPLHNPAALLASEALRHERNSFPDYTREVARVLAVLEAIMGDYNFDHSDSQSDHFHVRFYGNAEVHWEYARDRRAELMASPTITSLLPDLLITVAGGDLDMARRQVASQNEGHPDRRTEAAELKALLFPEPERECA